MKIGDKVEWNKGRIFCWKLKNCVLFRHTRCFKSDGGLIMKIIKVKSCKDCPHLGSTGDHCNKSLSRRILSTERPTPDWCPLEEVHGANNWINIKDQLPLQERVLVWLWEKILFGKFIFQTLRCYFSQK